MVMQIKLVVVVVAAAVLQKLRPEIAVS